MEHFFRLGEVVRVKTLDEVLKIKIIRHYNDNKCLYKNNIYQLYDSEKLINEVGVVVGGIYEKYLEVKIKDNVYKFPHFVLDLYEEIDDVVTLEENNNWEIEIEG